jgi:pimeloyl-ACP methyl ester carboxylesterase
MSKNSVFCLLVIPAILANLVLTGPVAAQTQPGGDRVQVNGMEMYYEVSGEGDPLIVLHGAHMNIVSMGEIIPKLAESHKVYALELQGHGRTTDIDRPITYEALADDVAGFMDAVGLKRADIFGYSMGGVAGLQLAIRHPDKVDHVALASIAFDAKGWQPAFSVLKDNMTVDMFLSMPMAETYKDLAANPDGYPALVEKLIALEHEPLGWAEEVKGVTAPVLVISGDADIATLEHTVELFRLLGGGVMGDMGEPLPAARLAILPASSHTAVIGQIELLHNIIEPFFEDEVAGSVLFP